MPMSRGSDPITIDKFEWWTAIIAMLEGRDICPGLFATTRLNSQMHKLGSHDDFPYLHTKAQATRPMSDQFVPSENRSDGGSDG